MSASPEPTAPPAEPAAADPDTPDGHARLLDGLARWLGADGTPVTRVQTHISSLLLAGDTVYKLKRPVRLPFLDFSNAARRRHFCEEELRLNRRTAPVLYRDVRPVIGTTAAPRLGDPGSGAAPDVPALDWVLRLRRFDPADEGHALAEAGRFTPALVDALAGHLTGFHAGLPPCTDDPHHPTRACADPWHERHPWPWVAASLDLIAAHPARPVEGLSEAVAAVRAALQAAAVRLEPLCAIRAAAGAVREGHGDLHLGNLVHWQGRVLAFDAIEFEPALRVGDLVGDIAFTHMDLLAHGLPALAWRLVGRWAEALDQFDGLPLLAPLAAYRAVVRAQVALLAGQPAGFARYWPLAQRLAAPPGPGRLVLTMGLSGSGKSTVAAALAEQLGGVRIRSDVERKRLAGLAPDARLAPGSPGQAALYSANTTRRTYGRLQTLAGPLLAAGLTVVVDAATLRQAEREALRATAAAAGAAFALVVCTAPVALLRARIAARAAEGTDPSDATQAVLALQQRVQEPIPPDWAPVTHAVVNDGDRDTLAQRVELLAAELARP